MMKKLLVVLAVLALAAGPAFAGLVNGDFSDGANGWVERGCSWGADMQWGTLEDNAAYGPSGLLMCTDGSFGWYQVVKDIAVGAEVTLTGDWKANGISWLEYDLFTVAAGTDDASIGSIFDSTPASGIAFKKDAWGVNPPTTFDWQSATLSPFGSGNGGVITNDGWVVVGLKLGSAQGSAGAAALFDNIELTAVPEPGSMVALMSGLLGLGGLVIRRKR